MRPRKACLSLAINPKKKYGFYKSGQDCESRFFLVRGRMRNNADLEKRLQFLWRNYFAEVPEEYPVDIKFGRSAKYRFGSIRYFYGKKTVQILINGRFRDKKYPQEIIDHTIAHEMVHYAQGFPTPGPRLHRYPHRGGVIDKELKERNLYHLVVFYNSWVEKYIESL